MKVLEFAGGWQITNDVDGTEFQPNVIYSCNG
jgi:hypothetical protein